MLIVTCSKSKVQPLVRRPRLPRLRQHNRILHAAVVIVDCQVYSMRIVTQLGLDGSSTSISEVVHLLGHTLWLFPARIAQFQQAPISVIWSTDSALRTSHP